MDASESVWIASKPPDESKRVSIQPPQDTPRSPPAAAPSSRPLVPKPVAVSREKLVPTLPPTPTAPTLHRMPSFAGPTAPRETPRPPVQRGASPVLNPPPAASQSASLATVLSWLSTQEDFEKRRMLEEQKQTKLQEERNKKDLQYSKLLLRSLRGRSRSQPVQISISPKRAQQGAASSLLREERRRPLSISIHERKNSTREEAIRKNSAREEAALLRGLQRERRLLEKSLLETRRKHLRLLRAAPAPQGYGHVQERGVARSLGRRDRPRELP